MAVMNEFRSKVLLFVFGVFLVVFVCLFFVVVFFLFCFVLFCFVLFFLVFLRNDQLESFHHGR